MTRGALLDANVLVALFDEQDDASDALSADVRTALDDVLSDPEARLFITPLIRYEVLRGVPRADEERYSLVKSWLDGLTELDVTRDASEHAAELFRLYVAEHRDDPNLNVDKRRFDTFHFAVARLRGLKLISEDHHIEALTRLDARLQQSV